MPVTAAIAPSAISQPDGLDLPTGVWARRVAPRRPPRTRPAPATSASPGRRVRPDTWRSTGLGTLCGITGLAFVVPPMPLSNCVSLGERWERPSGPLGNRLTVNSKGAGRSDADVPATIDA